MPPSIETRAVPGRFKPGLEAAYQDDLADEKVRVFYLTCLLFSLVYLCFGFLDVFAVPGNVVEAWVIRAAVVLVTAGATLLARYRRTAFLRHYTLLVCLTYFSWALGIEVIILLADPSDLAWSNYYFGVVLASIALYVWTYLRPLLAAVTGLAIALTYIVLALVHQRLGEGDGWIVLLANLFFLVSANVGGLFSMLMRERFSRQAYLLKNALRRDLELEEEAKRQSEFLAEHDPLTGLPNRVRFLRKLGGMIAASKDGAEIAVLFIDLDGFKAVNDQHGHAAGDQVLRCVAERVRGVVRGSDLAARLGGDELVIALPLGQYQGAATIERVSEALRESIAAPVQFNGVELRVTASIGAATCPEHGRTAEELMHSADQNMYESKRRRRNVRAAETWQI